MIASDCEKILAVLIAADQHSATLDRLHAESRMPKSSIVDLIDSHLKSQVAVSIQRCRGKKISVYKLRATP